VSALPDKPRHVVGTGFLVGKEELTNFLFDPSKPYSACRICGEVFQTELDRRIPPGHEPHNSLIARLGKLRRDEWRKTHHGTHTEQQHNMLALSGSFATPEAAQKLAQMGIIPISDMVLNDESEAALAEGSATPTEDAEGSR
jgi:hypothetical protein